MSTVGEVARRVGVRSSAVRRQNGYRSYNDNSIKLLLFTMRARSLGITFKEIKFLLNLILSGKKP